jgi:hypothetical protein
MMAWELQHALAFFKQSLENNPKLTVFKVINTGKTYFANLNLGIVPKKVARYNMITQVSRTGDVYRTINQSAWKHPMN